ncbi:S8 family serine peptidase [Paraburkholderia sp. RP-4-7]|uniref:S8 family serine peptidase n=1 Tax=Paraburkholderia polaris TaxID=2728848 RepID=A0A848ISR7_9BURK|nr:S8 family serine peptidase [Paraburkholderia polaris]NMM02167.1 S8 family serine peptidase [Paraburkholderia polaris]
MKGLRSENGPLRVTGATEKRRGVVAGLAGVFLSLALGACGGSGGGDTTAQTTQESKEPQTLEQTASLAAANPTTPLALSLKMNTSSLGPDASVDRFIIKYKDGTTESGSTTAVQSRLDRLAGSVPSKAHYLRRMGRGSDVVTTDRKLKGVEAKAFMRAIASDPNVEFVEPDTVMTIGSSPNDPLYSKQWSLSSNQTPGTTTAGIRAEGAWDIANGAGVVIGVVDSGITSHSDLNPNVLPGYEFTSGTYGNRGGDGTQPANKPGENCNVMWHGTHVAGIMAAGTNNGIGIAGIAPAAKVVSVRTVRNCNGGYMSDMADGITWAAGGTVSDAPVNPNPAKVINISLYAYGACQTSLQNAIDYATGKGSVVVVIAGNYSTDAAKVQPANCHNVITVGAINSDSTKWVSSDFGPTVDIAAPGNNIWSTYNDGKTAPGTEGYGLLSGTSQAAPMVSGVAALVQSIAPAPLTVAEMRTLIQQTAQPFTPQKPDQPIGTGIVDATAAVKAVKSGKIPAAADFTCTQSPNLMQLICKDLSTARGGVPIRSWNWNFGDGKAATVVSRSTNPVVDYDYPGMYQITLTTTDENGAVSTTSLPVSVAALSITDITDDD